MSFVCHEDGQPLRVRDEAYCVTIESSPDYCALCYAHLTSIPTHLRLKERVDRGVDIHMLFGRPNTGLLGLDDTLRMRDAEFGDYKFSISAETARQYLPRCAAMYLS